MKIIKESLKKLVEADETITDSEKTLADIDPKTASKEEVASAAKNSVEDVTDSKATLSDTNAEKLADTIKDGTKALNTDKVVIMPSADDADAYKFKNTITDTLDECRRIAERSIRMRVAANANLLVIGLYGAGKTATVRQWAADNKLILVELNSREAKIDQMLNGMPLRDKNAPANSPNRIAWAFAEEKLGPLLDPKNKNKCVLYVDELNRQEDLELRSSFYSLFNEKRNSDGSLDFKDTLLFSIATINPHVKSDRNATRLNGAERGRFGKRRGAWSTAEEAVNFFETWKGRKLLDYNIILPDNEFLIKKYGKAGPYRELTPTENEDVNTILKTADMGVALVTNPNFSFDGEDLINGPKDIEGEEVSNMLDQIESKGYNQLTKRDLFDLIYGADGDPKQVLKNLDNGDKIFLPDTEQMLRDCISTYIQDLPALRKEIGLDGGTIATPNIDKEEPKNKKEEPQEDNDELFTKQAGGKVAKSESSVAQELNSFKLNF